MSDARFARDGEEFAVYSNGGHWLTAWHAPEKAPGGTPHGANGLCVTPDSQAALISSDGVRWGWPGGRPESGYRLSIQHGSRRTFDFSLDWSSGDAAIEAIARPSLFTA